MPTLTETIKGMKPTTPSADRMKSEMEKVVEDLIVDVFGEKIDEIVAEKAEEQVMQMLKVLRGPEGKKGKDALPPIKGVDYFTPQEAQRMLDEITPRKGVHYNDGIQGKSVIGPKGDRGDIGPVGLQGKQGGPGKDGNIADLKGEEIVKKINELPFRENLQIDAFHIKNLPKGKTKAHGGGDIVLLYDLSSSLNGSTTVFTIPRNRKVVLITSSSTPFTFRETTDYTLSGSGVDLNRTLTFTAEITASTMLAQGQTINILYAV